MGTEGSIVSDTACGALTVVVAEPVGSPPRPPQPQAEGCEQPPREAARATIEQTGAGPPPEA